VWGGGGSGGRGVPKDKKTSKQWVSKNPHPQIKLAQIRPPRRPRSDKEHEKSGRLVKRRPGKKKKTQRATEDGQTR